jgi:uncharacterized protein DUF3501
MARPVERREIVDLTAYELDRDAFRSRVLAAKALRRVHIGDYLTLLFENPLTVRYQIQEMLRTERIVREPDIGHELDTYNELLGGPGELGVTMLIEIDDPAERAEKLTRWLTLPESVYLRRADGEKIRARIDERQRDGGRISSVHYLRFDVRGEVPVAAGCDLPELATEVVLDDARRAALAEDLRAD